LIKRSINQLIKWKNIMPRVSKNTPSSSSEVISNADSDSETSNNAEVNYGSGDEGNTISISNIAQNKTTIAASPERHVLYGSAKVGVGLFCSLVAVAGAVDLIYFGIQLNNSDANSRETFSPFFTVGAVMAGVGTVCSMLACASNTNPNIQAQEVSA
jgi:hypothetical protein